MKTENNKGNQSLVKATVTGEKILLKLPKNETDIVFIRSLGYVRWDGTAFCWVIMQHLGNVDKINRYFGDRIQWVDEPVKENSETLNSVPTEPKNLVVVKYHNGRIRLIFKYDHDLVSYIKQIPFHCWDAEMRWWTLPHTEKILTSDLMRVKHAL